MEDQLVTSYESTIRYLETYLQKDRQFKSLPELLNVKQSGSPTVSGLNEVDYPETPNHVGGELSVMRTSPLPADLMDKFAYMQQNCLMGLFPEGQRVWLTVDKDIYVWNYDDGSDLAYYDGLDDTIICVGFVKPKIGVFHPDIHYVLCVATPVEVVMLGVTLLSPSGLEPGPSMHLLPEPLHRVITDNQTVSCIQGTWDGRIMLGTRSGCILEIVYGIKSGWFSLPRNSVTRTCHLVNHSTSTLSLFLPNILTLGFKEEDSIVELSVDAERGLLYARSEHSSVSMYSLGTSQTPPLPATAFPTAAPLPPTSTSSPGTLTRITTLTEKSLVSTAAYSARSVDKGQLGGIVHLSPLPLSAQPLQLMLVTKSGIRYYFGDRFHLLHIRLPPPSAGIPKIGQVRLAAESRGTVLLVSSRGEDSDVLYTLSPDPFPWFPYLAESCKVACPPGRAWVLLPITPHETDSISPHNGANNAVPPVVITQHVDRVRRFLLVSAQSVVHLELPSPLHQLTHLLRTCDKPISPQLKAWFNHFTPDEAVYAALVIASDTQDTMLADKAKKAVFFHCATTFQQENLSTLGSSQFPTPPVTMSTPGGLRQPSYPPATDGASFVTPIHRGLAVYAARILRPIWDQPMVTQMHARENEIFLVSRFDTEELSWFLHHLQHLQIFIRDHLAQLRTSSPPPLLSTDLADLLHMATEILGLWRLLAEHQFYLIAKRLTGNLQIQLIDTPVKQLLSPSRRNLVAGLIGALLDHYLADAASIEAITSKLQSVCPTLFGSEDALCAKANEMLVQVLRLSESQSLSPSDCRRLLQEAVSAYQEVGRCIDLGAVLPRLQEVGCYWGMVALCLSVAKQRDPEGRALVRLKEGMRPHSEAEKTDIDGRSDAYRRMLETLDSLVDQCSSSAPIAAPAPSPVPPHRHPKNTSVVSDEGGPHAARQELHTILADIFASSDLLAHYEVFRWLLDKSMTEEMMTSQSPHLESYLRNRLRLSPDDLPLRDLLWRHCEREGKRLEAARVLEHLALTYSENVRLDERIDYLTRAIVCVKALAGHQNESDYLNDLEDKLELAHLQRQVVQELRSATHSSQEVVEACEMLQFQLFNLTALFTQFAEPYALHSCQLSLLRAASHDDPVLVASCWRHMLHRVLHRPLPEIPLRDALTRLADNFKDTPAYFPLEILVYHIESYSCDHSLSTDWGVTCFEAMKIDLLKLVYAYDKVLKTKDYLLNQKDFKMHLYDVIYILFERFLALTDSMPPRIRQINSSQFIDLITSYIIEFQSSGDPSTSPIAKKMKQIKDELDRLI